MGKDKTVDLCSWFNEQPRLTARINTVKVSIEDCLKATDEQYYISNHNKSKGSIRLYHFFKQIF